MENALINQQGGTLSISGDQRRGFEEPTSKEDLQIPRATLLQALSPDVVDSKEDPVTHALLRPGMIINSITKQVLPGEFIPVFKFTNWIRFNPRDSKHANFDPAYGAGDIIWRSSDPLDPKVIEEGKFGPNGEPPMATKFINFFSFFPGVSMPVVVSFSKTSMKAGRRLLSMAQFSGRDMYATKYKLASRQEKGEAGTYFVFEVDQVGLASVDEMSVGEALWNQYANKPIQIHEPEVATESLDE